MSIFISLSVIFWSLFPSLLSYTQNSPEPNKVHLQNIIDNGEFSNGFNGWININDVSNFNVINNKLVVESNSSASTLRFGQNINIVSGTTYYLNTKYRSLNQGFNNAITTRNDNILVQSLFTTTSDTTLKSINEIFIATSNANRLSFGFGLDVGKSVEIDKTYLYNISEMKLKGVKDDNGVSFSSLTNEQIKAQLDIWVSQIPSGYNFTYYLTTSINDNYKWFSTGFVDKTGERDFLDYLGFFVWLAVPPISIYLLYKLMKGLIYE